MFLQILQNSQENTCIRLLKRNSGTGIFLWILRNFWEKLFYGKPLGDCFCRSNDWLTSILYKSGTLLAKLFVKSIHTPFFHYFLTIIFFEGKISWPVSPLQYISIVGTQRILTFEVEVALDEWHYNGRSINISKSDHIN